MALTQNNPLVHLRGENGQIPLAAVKVFEGSALGDNGAGYGRPLVAGDRFRGHSLDCYDNSAGSAGDRIIEHLTGRYNLEVALAGEITDVGRSVYMSDDATYTFSSAGNSYVGKVARYVDAAYLEVAFEVGGVDEFGPNPNRALKTDDYTVLATDNGKIIELGTDAKTITLLATVAGFQVTVLNTGADGTAGIVVAVAAADKLLGGCGLAAGADGAAATNTKATQRRGDYIALLGDGTNGWNIVGKRGIWAIA